MTTASPHAKLIDAAARKYLRPLGCIQKGRSRVWLLDRSWFISVVEFQPSSWSKGSYLNVSAHFLWVWHDHVSFDLGDRMESFIEFTTEEQFAEATERLASRAVIELQKIDLKLPNLDAITPSTFSPAAMEGSPWPLYHCAVAYGLNGKTDEAQKIFKKLASLATAPEWQHALAIRATELLQLLPNRVAFAQAISRLVTEHRLKLKLPNIAFNPDGFAAG